MSKSIISPQLNQTQLRRYLVSGIRYLFKGIFGTQVQSSMVHACPPRPETGTGSGGATWYAFLKRSHWILRQEFLRNGRGKPGLGQGFKVNWWKLHGFEILRGGTLPVTAAVHRFINCVKQYEKCDPAAGEIPLSVPLLAGNCEHDSLNTEIKNMVWNTIKPIPDCKYQIPPIRNS